MKTLRRTILMTTSPLGAKFSFMRTTFQDGKHVSRPTVTVRNYSAASVQRMNRFMEKNSARSGGVTSHGDITVVSFIFERTTPDPVEVPALAQVTEVTA